MDGLLQDLLIYWASVQEYFAFDHSRLTEPDMIFRLSLQVLLLLGSAFFSGSETALFPSHAWTCRNYGAKGTNTPKHCMPC